MLFVWLDGASEVVAGAIERFIPPTPGDIPIGAIEIEVALISETSIPLRTNRAVFGSLSRPPCMASLALISASPSKCWVNATNITTSKASCHIP